MTSSAANTGVQRWHLVFAGEEFPSHDPGGPLSGVVMTANGMAAIAKTVEDLACLKDFHEEAKLITRSEHPIPPGVWDLSDRLVVPAHRDRLLSFAELAYSCRAQRLSFN